MSQTMWGSVPVTAKLSKAFYDRLGEDIANELVEWFNQVDATYRSDLETTNELNFQRFGDRLDRRAAQIEARLDQQIARLELKLDRRVSALEATMGQRMSALEADVGQRLSRMEITLERRLGEQTRWLFFTWATLLIPIIGLWIRG